jgi:hypothetical protein
LLTFIRSGKYNELVKLGLPGIRIPLRKMGRTMGRGDAAKAFLAGLVAFCFALDPFVGPIPWLQIKKAMVRKDVSDSIIHGIENDRLVVLRFLIEETETLLRWEHSGEFEYNSQMYDVIETWTVGDTVYYRCWWDREETKLNDRLRELAERVFQGALKIGGPGDRWSSSPRILLCAGPDNARISTPELCPQPVWAFSDSYSSIIIPPPTPPPRRG